MLAATGEALSERAGLLNLGVEGLILAGAFAAFWCTLETGSHLMGMVAGLLTGAALGMAFGLLATVGGADQVVLGLGLTLGATGGTAFLFRELYGSSQPLLGGGFGRPLAGQGDWLPVVGPALADQRWPVYAAWGLVGVLHLVLFRTMFGLRIRAAGESPLGLEATGGSVTLIRFGAACLGGAMGGLAGGILSVVELGFFTPGASAGVGFLAIALAMLGRLSPLRVAGFTLAFGLLTGLDTGLQVAGAGIRPELLHMAPYIGMVAALVIFGRGARLPAALGRPWRRSAAGQ
jgi:simple sugar transport system permease protein